MRGGLTDTIAGWIIVLLLLIGAAAIIIVDDFSIPYISFALLLFLVTIFMHNRLQPEHAHFSRFFLGIVFVFSGFVKGVDPVGTQYQIEDYFMVYGMEWAKPFSLALSVTLNSFEFIMGVLLLFGVKIRLVAWLALVVMAFFTLTTLNDALYDPVPDCGCFGDAITMSNWQTLYKNLIINIFVVIVFACRKRLPARISKKTGTIILVSSILVFIGFEIYNIRHLPIIDFRDWKEGKRMMVENPLPKQYYVVYKNTLSGETEEFLLPDYPYDDPEWMAAWEFVNTRVVDLNPRFHNLVIIDPEEGDITSSIIENPDYQVIFVTYDLHKMNAKKADLVKEIIKKCEAREISVVFLTSSLQEEVEILKETTGIDEKFYYADDTELQAMIRSNPGLILLKGGTVLKKIHHNDFHKFNRDFETYLKD